MLFKLLLDFDQTGLAEVADTHEVRLGESNQVAQTANRIGVEAGSDVRGRREGSHHQNGLGRSE